MGEIQTGVNEPVSQTEPISPVAQNEQVPTASEGVKPQETDDKYENLKKALHEERERRRAAEAKLTAEEPEEPSYQEPTEVEKRFYQAEANADLALRLVKDPFVKENLDLIESEMRAGGKTVDQAITAIKAKVFDTMYSQTQVVPTEIPKQLTPTQVNEPPTAPVSTGNPIQDMLNDPTVPIEAKNTLRREFGL